MITGLQSPCRFCGAMVTYGTMVGAAMMEYPEDSRYAHEGWWDITTQDHRCPEGEDGKRKLHKPTLYCIYKKGNGEVCHKKIKPEDVKVKHYACGVHMRNVLADIAQAEEMAAELERQQERQEILKWEANIYEAGFKKIIELLGDEIEMLIDGYRDNPVERRGRSGEIYRVHHYMRFEIAELADKLQELMTPTTVAPNE